MTTEPRFSVTITFCHFVCGVLEDERAGPRGSRADSGGGAGARERDGRTAARQDRGEDV